MSSDIIRWEWRTFGPGFGPAENRIQKQPMESEHEKRDLFILSELSNDMIAIRDQHIKVKTPLRQSADGLHQWASIMKMEFPLSPVDLALLYKVFGLPLPLLEKNQYACQEFLDDIVKPCGWLSMASVGISRSRYIIQEARVDMCDVSIAGIETRSIAVKHEDPAVVIQLVKDLGLAEYKAETLIRAVKRVMEVPWYVPEIP